MMAQVHSSRSALDRARTGISVFSVGMVAADEAHRSSIAAANREADDALENRERDLRRAKDRVAAGRAMVRSAEGRRAAAESELASARASVPSDRRYASAALARVSRAESALDVARSDERVAHGELRDAQAAEERATEARDRCASARRRIQEAARGYRSSALTYVAASSAIIAAGRRRLGRLSSLLDDYLAISAYDASGAVGSPPSSSAAASAAATAGGTGTRRTAPAWATHHGLAMVPLQEIDPVSSDACDGTDRWMVQRFERQVEAMLQHEDWETRLRDDDEAHGRSGPRTLLGVARRICLDPVELTAAEPRRVLSGAGLVAAAQRAGLPAFPARIVEEES